jgi:hypothetical protein
VRVKDTSGYTLILFSRFQFDHNHFHGCGSDVLYHVSAILLFQQLNIRHSIIVHDKKQARKWIVININ